VAGSSADLVIIEVTTPMQAPTTTTTTATVDTGSGSVPGPPLPLGAPPLAPPPRQRPTRTARLWVALAIVGGLLATALVVTTFVRIPYYAFAPGSATPTEQLVSVGGDQPTYLSDTKGAIFFLTVNLRQVSASEAFADWIDPDIDLIGEQRVLQGRTAEENRAAQAQAMVGSKSEAIVVAFNRLGLPYDPTGEGAVVLGVSPGTPADGVIDVGDTIVGVDGTPVELDQDLADAIGAHPPGSTISIELEPFDGGDDQTVQVTLAPRPDDGTRGFLGVTSDTRDFDPRPAFPIDIDQGQVGGPSAGLAFTLAILDVLTPGDLTGGTKIAVTGAIESDGTVTPVGGVAQKTAAAAEAGATVLIVPAGEEADAERNDHGLQIISVTNIDDALKALQDLGGDPLPAPEATTAD
jgi:PDZ domain-containing protein